MTNSSKTKIQLIWGIALTMAGIGVFFRIPQVMPQIEAIERFSDLSVFIRFCFYLMGILLIGGGAKKVYQFYQHPNKNESD